MSYRVSVWLCRSREWSLTICAENANDAVIKVLCQMGLTSLENVTGISICAV